MHASLLAQFVAAAKYPSIDAGRPATDKIYEIVTRSVDTPFGVSLIVFEGIAMVVAIAIEQLPESTEQEVVAILSLPPGEIIEPHSDVISALVRYRFNYPAAPGQTIVERRNLYERITMDGLVVGHDAPS